MRYFTVYEKHVASEYEVKVEEGLIDKHFQVSINSVNDYVEENEKLLIDWLMNMNQFPYIAYIAAYEDMYDCPHTFLTAQKIPFEKVVIASEKKPVYIVTLSNSLQLTKVLEKLYWLPAQNEMMLLTNCKEAVELTEWKVSSKSTYTRLSASLHLQTENCTVIEILHDGQGMGITSAKQTPYTAKEICKFFPKGYTVQQWDDEVLIPYEI